MNYVMMVRLHPAPRQYRPPPAGMASVFQNERVEIWSDDAGLALGGDGWIAGHLFGRTRPYEALREIAPTSLAKIAATGGRAIFDIAWGGYVGLWCAHDGTIRIFRDPSAIMPAFISRTSELMTISSDARLLPGKGAMNAIALGRLLTGLDAVGRQTCLEGIEELIAGECLTIGPGQADTSAWWAPWDMLSPPNQLSFEEAASLLRERVTDCTAMWRQSFGKALIGVSGGLDSSIVTASAWDMRCMTVIGPDPEGDETAYARALTTSLGIELEEHRLDLADVDIETPPFDHMPWPVSSYFWHAIKAIHQRSRARGAIDVIFSGNGGDNVFCSMRTAVALADRWRAEGLSHGCLETFRDLQVLTGATWMEVLRESRRHLKSYGDPYRPIANTAGLAQPIQQAIVASPDVHPWFQPPCSLPPGMRTHIALLTRAHKGLELYPRGEGPDHIAPLLSQPIVETCMMLPSWYWVRGGRNRAVARTAFEGRLPDMILNRRSKGGPGGFMDALYRQKHKHVCAMLLDGLLLKHGIIERTYVEAPDDWTWRGKQRAQRLLQFGLAEAWARSWESRKPIPSRA